MPNVPGLTPIDDPSLQGRTNASPRVVPRDAAPDPQRLQAVAAPVDTYARPAMPQDNGLSRLAESLSAFNSGLTRYADQAAVEDHADIPGRVMAAKLASANDQEFKAKLAADPGLQSRLAQRLGMKQLGLSTAEGSIEKMRQDYQTGGFDKINGNLDQWMAQHAQADLAAHGNDPSFAAGYAERFDAAKRSFQADQGTARAQQAVDAQNQTIFGAGLAIVNGDADTSADPSKTVGSLMAQMRSNQDFLKKSPQEQANLQLALAKNLMARISEDPQRAPFLSQVAQGLLQADRTGPDGKSIGSLMTNVETSGQAASIFANTRAAAQKSFNETHVDETMRLGDLARTGDPSFQAEFDRQVKADPKRYTPAQQVAFHHTFEAASARLQGAAAKQQAEEGVRDAENASTTQALLAGQKGDTSTLQDVTIPLPNGKEKVISADDRMKAATTARMAQIDHYAATSGDQDGAWKQKVDWFALNPRATNEEWKSALRAAPAAITASVQGNGAMPPALTSAYDLYKRLDASAPGVAYQHSDDRSRDLFERAQVNERMFGQEPQEALANAARVITDPTFDKNAEDIPARKFNEKANSLLGTWFFQGKGVLDTSNQNEVRRDLYAATQNLVKGNHLSWDQAIGVAAERIKNNYAVVNGVAVRTADKRVPQDFGDVANRYFDGYWDLHHGELEKLGYHKDDLSMAAVGDGNAWRIVDRNRLTDPGIPDSTVTLGDMVDTSRALQADTQAKEAARQVTTQEDRQRQFFYQAGLLKAQVDANRAINIGPMGLMKRSTARDALKAMLANPDYAAGKALTEADKATHQKQLEAEPEIVPGL